MKLRILIQWNCKRRMRVAEHMPAMPTVVSSLQQREGSLADGRIADQRIGVWFPTLARRWPCYCAQVVGGDRLVFGDFPERFLLALSGRAPAYRSPGRGAIEAVGAAMDAAGRGEG